VNESIQRVMSYYGKVQGYLESDPETSVSIARKTAEAVCCEVFLSSKKKMGKKMMLNDLIQNLSRDNLLPPHVAVSLGTIQAFGNFGTHYQHEAGKHITKDYVMPCIHALTTVVNWYVEDFCKESLVNVKKPKSLPIQEVSTKALAVERSNKEPRKNNSNSDKKEVDLVGGAKLRFLKIRVGSYNMGSSEKEAGRKGDEILHEVNLNPFCITETVITQSQYKAVMGSNPSSHQLGDSFPVENVTWFEALKFCEKVSILLQVDCDLPTEAEWEFCCKSGKPSLYSFEGEFDDNMINCDGRSQGLKYIGKTTPVHNFPMNDYGLYDMCGNVFEWCKDCYSRKFYQSSPKDNPLCQEGRKKVVRGGSYESESKDCRCAARRSFDSSYKSPDLGFRVVIRGDINVG